MDMNPDIDHADGSAKRRKISPATDEWLDSFALPFQPDEHEDSLLSSKVPHEGILNHHDAANISLSRNPRFAGQTVAPFLAEHIPDQYNPLGVSPTSVESTRRNPNSKYCYRHRPDLKCRRQANEPSMDQLHHVRHGLVHKYTSIC